MSAALAADSVFTVGLATDGRGPRVSASKEASLRLAASETGGLAAHPRLAMRRFTRRP